MPVITFSRVLALIALVLFALAAFGVAAIGPASTLPLGLAFLAAAAVVP